MRRRLGRRTQSHGHPQVTRRDAQERFLSPPDTPHRLANRADHFPSTSQYVLARTLFSLKLSNLMTPPHLLYLSLPTLFIDVESAETTLKTLRNRLCYHFRRAPRTMESHFSSYALMQLSSPHTHSPSPNTPPNLLLFILDLKSTEKLENERSVTSRDRHSCQICDLSRSPSTISQLFA